MHERTQRVVRFTANAGLLFAVACSSQSPNPAALGPGNSSGSGGSAGANAVDPSGGSAGSTEGTSGAGGSADPDGPPAPRDAGFPDVGFEYIPGTAADGGACLTVQGEATASQRPMDIVVVIDNSYSMAGEIAAVQASINTELAQIIEQSGIDYRVIMVSRYANVAVQNQDGGNLYDSAYGICISPPLGAQACPSDNSEPAALALGPRFFHHSTNIGSRNVWCRLAESYALTDPHPVARDPWTIVAPDGWGAWLRDDAFKVFVAISDDSPGLGPIPSGHADDVCRTETGFSDDASGAASFDLALRNLSGAHFGSEAARNYAWYSIVGMAGNDPVNPTPLEPGAGVQTSCCQGGGATVACPNDGATAPVTDGVRAGVGYQELSRLTGGLRYPSCFNANFSQVFNAIAAGVIDRSAVPCEYVLPDAPGIINVADIQASFQSSGGGVPVLLPRVLSSAACSGQAFYLDDENNPTRLSLCPDACNAAQADDGARLTVDFGCLGS